MQLHSVKSKLRTVIPQSLPLTNHTIKYGVDVNSVWLPWNSIKMLCEICFNVKFTLGFDCGFRMHNVITNTTWYSNAVPLCKWLHLSFLHMLWPDSHKNWLSFTFLSSVPKATEIQLYIPRQFGLSLQNKQFSTFQFHGYDLPTFLVVILCAMLVDQAGSIICTKQFQPGYPDFRNYTLKSNLSKYNDFLPAHLLNSPIS